MIRIETLADGVLAATIQDRLTREDFASLEAMLESERERSGRLSLLIDLRAMRSIDPQAFLTDLRASLRQVGRMADWSRLALVTDNSLLHAVARFQAPFIPGPTVRTFCSEQIDEARLFASGASSGTDGSRDGAPASGIARIETDRPDVVAFSITSKISPDDAKAARLLVEEVAAQHPKIDILVRIDGWQGFDLSILIKPDSWSTNSALMRSLRRYALVGAPQALSGVSDLIGTFMPFQVRTFALDNEDAAWSFIEARRRDAATTETETDAI